MSSHERSGVPSDDWLTPPELVQALGPFDLDPCTPPRMPWRTAKFHYTPEEDGLLQPWAGNVWLNPPYGTQTWKWLNRLALHGQGIALIFARTETEGFHRFVWRAADAVLFIKGRLTFHNLDGSRYRRNAGAPSVLAAFGAANARRLEDNRQLGQFIRLRPCPEIPSR